MKTSYLKKRRNCSDYATSNPRQQKFYLWPCSQVPVLGQINSSSQPHNLLLQNPVLSFHLRPYLLTPWCRVLLEKLTGLQLVKNFPAFHGTPRFITALTSVRHLSISWASPIQSIYPHPTSWRSVLILSTHLCLGLPSGLLPSGFPSKTLYTPLSSPIRATCPAHLIYKIHTKWNRIGPVRSIIPEQLRSRQTPLQKTENSNFRQIFFSKRNACLCVNWVAFCITRP